MGYNLLSEILGTGVAISSEMQFLLSRCKQEQNTYGKQKFFFSPLAVLHVIKVHTPTFIQKNYNVLMRRTWIRLGDIRQIHTSEAVGVNRYKHTSLCLQTAPSQYQIRQDLPQAAVP